jgi:shikimate kinase
MKVFLLGLPGSGKTTIGKKLASALELPFVDLDKEIERTEGKPISEIFSEKKEDYFRKLESSLLKQWCARPEDYVMATGGGAPCFFDNIQVINNAGKSIFLDVPASEIVKRMSRAGVEKRPLLAASGIDGLKDHIEFMRSNRITYYNQASFTFSGPVVHVQDMVAALTRP